MRRAAAAVLAALVLAPLAAAATKAPVFGLRAVGANKRGYFVYAMAPGSVKRGSVIVTNVGTAAGTVKLFVADGTTGSTSGTVYKTDTAPTATGRWIELDRTSLAVPMNGNRKVGFTVRVPAGAPAGQWVAGIVAETSRQEARQRSGKKTRVQIRIRDLTIVAVQVNVPGPRVVSFAIGKVTTGGTRGFQKVIVRLANTGNVLAKPRGVITIFDKSGNVVQTLPFTLDTFLPRTAIDYPVLLKKALPAGDYTATVRLTVPGAGGTPGKTFNAKPAFAVSDEDVKQVFTSATPQAAPPTASSGSGGVPWPIVAATAAIVALLLVLLWLRRRKGGALDEAKPGTTYVRSPSAMAAEAAPAPEPEPAPVPEPPAPAAAPPLPPPPAPAAPPVPPHEHFWEVAYDRGTLGEDGVWRFPHRCRECGRELLARDIADATAQASQL